MPRAADDRRQGRDRAARRVACWTARSGIASPFPHLCTHPDLPAVRRLPDVPRGDRRHARLSRLLHDTGGGRTWWSQTDTEDLARPAAEHPRADPARAPRAPAWSATRGALRAVPAQGRQGRAHAPAATPATTRRSARSGSLSRRAGGAPSCRCAPLYRGMPLERSDPFIDRDLNLCILCGRCVRDLQGAPGLGDHRLRRPGQRDPDRRGLRPLAERGGLPVLRLLRRRLPDRKPGRPLRQVVRRARRAPQTTCTLCEAACALKVDASASEPRRLRAAVEHARPLCVLGRFAIPGVPERRRRACGTPAGAGRRGAARGALARGARRPRPSACGRSWATASPWSATPRHARGPSPLPQVRPRGDAVAALHRARSPTQAAARERSLPEGVKAALADRATSSTRPARAPRAADRAGLLPDRGQRAGATSSSRRRVLRGGRRARGATAAARMRPAAPGLRAAGRGTARLADRLRAGPSHGSGRIRLRLRGGAIAAGDRRGPEPAVLERGRPPPAAARPAQRGAPTSAATCWTRGSAVCAISRIDASAAPAAAVGG